ncbi:16S rRNA (cytosine(967)-C(5))-methyltransferase RsmB [candidate division KSB1 bacterium]|nr:16S rRNA (cytosine(967)-C(5))-methyltransferase RsmB [candidate division KSB1 bacterium]
MKARQLAIHILKSIDAINAYADISIDHALKQAILSDSDRRLVHEIVNGTIRQSKKIQWAITQFFQGKYHKAPEAVRLVLEISFYQILFLTKLPHYAVINEAVSIIKKQNGQFWANKVNAILRNLIRHPEQIDRPANEIQDVETIAIQFSHPEWMIERWVNRFGVENVKSLCAANNRSPDITLRVNTLKTNRDDVRIKLHEFGIIARGSDYLPESIIINQMNHQVQHELLLPGLVAVQDESASMVTRLLDPQPGELVYDLCAAPGGKTTHISERAGDSCFVVAVDAQNSRLKRVKENVQRLGIVNCALVQADARYFEAKAADKVLLDVPCSGLGVLAKRVDLRWRRSLDDIKNISTIQEQILEHASLLVKPDGVIVYSTCTIEPDENEKIVESFLARHPEFTLENPVRWLPEAVVQQEKYLYTYPHIHGTDGAFAARIRKLK